MRISTENREDGSEWSFKDMHTKTKGGDVMRTEMKERTVQRKEG